MIGPKLAVSLRFCVSFSVVLCLSLGSTLVAEESAPAPPLVVKPALSVAPSASCPAPANLLGKPQEPVFLSGDCTATADCWDGSQKTCSASGPSGECSFVDSNCPTQRGYCWSSDEGTKWCPPCPCEVTTACSFYEGRKCTPGIPSPTCNESGICAHCFCPSSGRYICP